MEAHDLVVTAQTGTRLETLKVLRDTLAERIAVPPDVERPEPIASIARQLRDTLKEIEELSVDTDDDALSELRAKREARTKPAKRAARRKPTA